MRRNVPDLRRLSLSHDDALHGYIRSFRPAYRFEMPIVSPFRRQNFGLVLAAHEICNLVLLLILPDRHGANA
jgi:hypothetical protein